MPAARKSVLLVVSGRPYAIGRRTRVAHATVQAFFPGQEGGAAIAGVLSGRVNPSGRLPVQIPGDNAAQPGTYLAPPLALKSDGVSNIDPTPAFPFGHGLTCTTFRVDEISVSKAAIGIDGSVAVRAKVANTGFRPGVSVPQLYLTDPVTSVTRPVRQPIGFARIDLAAGEAAFVEFEVAADLTGFTGRDLRRRVEPGRIVLTVAQNAADPGRSAEVLLQGEVRFLDHTRTMSTETSVTRL